MGEENLCLYTMPDGSVQCASCNHPPSGSVYKSAAPAGLEPGNYPADDPRLAGTQDGPLPESGGEV